MRGRNFSTAWQRFFTSQAIVPILVGSLALGVAGNALFGILTNWLGTSYSAMVQIIFISLLVLAGAVLAFMYLASRIRSDDLEFDKQTPKGRRGLILLVSNEQACRTAIEWHLQTLEYCWLIFSERTEGIAQNLQMDYGAHKKIDLVRVYDVYDLFQFKEKVDHIYTHLPPGLAEQDVILDFTGMTAFASVGAVLACLNKDRPIQYVGARTDSQGKIVGSQPPMEVVLTTKPQSPRVDESGTVSNEPQQSTAK